MSNLFRWIFGLVLALAATNYFIFSLINLIPSLFTPSSYIYIFSLLFGCTYKFYRVMPNLFSDMGGLFISAIVDDVSSRITSPIISYAADVSSRITSPIISYAAALISHLLGCLRCNRDETKAGQMIFARDLKIEHSEKYENWQWINDPRATRFTEVAELLKVWWFSIKARRNFLGLSANTKYDAYLIFRTKQDSEGLDAIQKAMVSVGRKGLTKYVYLKPPTATLPGVGLPVERSDGWMELELGQFECNHVTGDKDVVISIEEINTDDKKTGLIVAGIEIRPI